MYKMKDEFKTGIELIDEQHKTLFDIADKAYHLLNNDFTLDKYDDVLEIIDELKDYTAYHFKSEEEYMDSIGYKRRFSQKIAHEKFIDKLNSVNLKVIDENQDESIKKILEFLNLWLTEHILYCDKLIGK